MNQQATTARPGKCRKPSHQHCVRVNITLPPQLYDAGQQLISKYKFSGYSEYLAYSIRKNTPGLEIAI